MRFFPALLVARTLPAAMHPGMPVSPTIVTGATDARTFRRAGIPVYGVSAQWLRVPDDLRINQRDERIPVASLYDGVRHWKIMLEALAGRSAGGGTRR